MVPPGGISKKGKKKLKKEENDRTQKKEWIEKETKRKRKRLSYEYNFKRFWRMSISVKKFY